MTAMQPRSREEAKILGLPEWQIDQMFPAQGGGLLGGLAPDTQAAVDQYADMPQQGLLAPEKPKGYFNGGEFRPRDGLSLLFASVADGMARNAGYEADAGSSLFSGRMSALDEFKKQAKQQREMQQRAEMIRAAYGDLSEPQVAAVANKLGDPGDFRPPAPTGTSRLMAESATWTPEQWDQYNKLNPQFFTGADKRQYQTNGPGAGLPDVLTDDQINALSGGGTGNGVGGF